MNPETKEYILEELFGCVYYGGLSYTEAYNISIDRRKWWIRRTIKEMERTKTNQGSQQNISPHQAEIHNLQTAFSNIKVK